MHPLEPRLAKSKTRAPFCDATVILMRQGHWAAPLYLTCSLCHKIISTHSFSATPGISTTLGLTTPQAQVEDYVLCYLPSPLTRHFSSRMPVALFNFIED